ncbi:hypothetical protein DRQ36_01145 [bacterium]|nr:MAG: hypothetical protein DRQ36_01145 [bacterium]
MRCRAVQIAAALTVAFCAVGFGEPSDMCYGEILVRPNSDTRFEQIEKVVISGGDRITRFLNLWDIYKIQCRIPNPLDVSRTTIEIAYTERIEYYASTRLFRWVVPNYPLVSASFHYPNDPYFGGFAGADTIPDQHYLELIDALSAWDYQTGLPSIRVGVISSGVDIDHPDLAANINPVDGYDFVGGVHGSVEEALNPGIYSMQEDGNPDIHYFGDDGWGEPDPSCGNGLSDYDSTYSPDRAVSRGTAAAGIIGAEIDNDFMFAGLAQCTIVPIRAINAEGWGYTSDVLQALELASILDIDIVYIDLAVEDDIVIRYGIDSLFTCGATIIAPSGDTGCDTVLFPAGYDNCICVGSCTSELDKSIFSNSGTHIGIVAPGGELEWGEPAELIWSTGVASVADTSRGYSPGEHIAYSGVGTGLSAAIVAGVLALVRAENPSYTNSECYSIITTTATDIIEPGWDNESGYGLLNAYRAVRLAQIEEYRPRPQKNSIEIVPNPFNVSCRIETPGTVGIFDISGRLVRTMEAGIWDGLDNSGENLPSGIYLIRPLIDGDNRVARVVLMK